MRPSPQLVLVVTVGGAIGTTARYAVTHLIGSRHLTGTAPLIPWATLLVNVVGAFLLGLLLERLSRAGAETPARQVVRLGLGTGLLGGFTTYSALALELHDLLAGADIAAAVAYGIGSVCAGLVACAAGIWLGARGDRR